MSASARSASFDCEATLHPVERVICGDEELLKLDEEMEWLVHKQQRFVVKGDSGLIDKQKSWLQEILDGGLDAENPAEYVQKYYKSHLDHLQTQLFPFAALKKHKVEKSIRINDILPDYDVSLTLEKSSDCFSDNCDFFRQLAIFPKGKDHLQQLIEVPLFGYFRDNPGELENDFCHEYLGMSCRDWLLQISTDPAVAKTIFKIGDYNFDGFPDFAIDQGNITNLGNSSYWVFLYDSDDKKFYYAPTLSDLFENSSFKTDEKNQVLIVDGYTYEGRRETATYKIEHNMPFPIRRN